MTTETKVEAVAVYVATAPERIYLQVADDEYCAQDPFPTGEEITWCADSVMALEVPYVRADLHQSALDALRGEVERKSVLLDQFMDKWAAEIRRADAAVRRVAQLEIVLEQAMAHPDFLPPGLLESIESALTKESP